MKKIKQTIFWAFLLVAVTACKKEQQGQGGTAPRLSTQEQVAALIQKADPQLYENIYGDNRTVEPAIHVHHGIFHWPASGGPNDGTCIWNPNCICMICIENPRMVTEDTPEYEIVDDFHLEYESSEDYATVIINDSLSTEVNNIKSLDIRFETGYSTFNYTLHD